MNYMGSKSRIAKDIVPIIQKAIDDNDIHLYLEPFLGGANVIDKIQCDTKFGYDINRYLICLFNHVKSGKELPEVISKEYYNILRKAWYDNNKGDKIQDWEIGLLWLSSYNGRGPDGGMSVEGYEKRKDGTVKYRNYYQERKNNLLKQFKQPLCRDIIFDVKDYRDLDNLNRYVIYADPPYFQKKQYANSKDFDYDEFWNKMREWAQNNIVFISEQQAPDDFECIWSQKISRSIKATDKQPAVEKLFIYRH